MYAEKKTHIWIKCLLIQSTGILCCLVIGFLGFLHLLFHLGLFLRRFLLGFHSPLQLTDKKLKEKTMSDEITYQQL